MFQSRVFTSSKRITMLWITICDWFWCSIYQHPIENQFEIISHGWQFTCFRQRCCSDMCSYSKESYEHTTKLQQMNKLSWIAKATTILLAHIETSVFLCSWNMCYGEALNLVRFVFFFRLLRCSLLHFMIHCWLFSFLLLLVVRFSMLYHHFE